jgi:hypothetical protein
MIAVMAGMTDNQYYYILFKKSHLPFRSERRQVAFFK